MTPKNEPRYHPTYLRDWRKHRGHSLRSLADGIRDESGQPLVSYVQLGRIERGLQPYSQPVLEAVAKVLGVDPATLLTFDPSTTPDTLLNEINSLDAHRRQQLCEIIKILRTGQEGRDAEHGIL